MQQDLKRISDLSVLAAGVAALLLAQPGRAQALPGALHDVPALAAQLRGFAGGEPRLDPRLVVPRCPAPALSWARSDVVRVDCAAPAWSLYVPVDGARGLAPVRAAVPARPAVKRGERVLVEAAGAGFAVSIEAQAERDADGDLVAVKGPGGRRFTARIAEDGKLILAR